MGYDLQAVIGGRVSRTASQDLPAARLASIGQGLRPDRSQALRRLGVVAGAGEDEFDAVGLGRHRSVEGWLGRGTRGSVHGALVRLVEDGGVLPNTRDPSVC
ncbi:hypothetical protein [Streptomyces sp. NPDC055243]|uniref:hypothetical protein n=1 Tax=Streptomyces sp. NPDC055243 TaxID=3365720 RepID=UPI0037D3129A